MTRLLRLSLKLFLLLLLLLVFVWLFLNSRLPSDDGTLSVSSLSQPVSIIKDKWGTPHIKAQNPSDAYFAYGYTVAKDRLFQMDIQRRLAQGELAEIMGSKLIKVDKMYRTLLFRNWSEKYLAASSKIEPKVVVLMDDYLAGINHFIETGPLPVEYTLLGVEPRKFNRLDSVSMAVYMAYSLCDGLKRDPLYTMLSEQLSPAELALLFPNYTDHNRVTIMEGDFTESQLLDTDLSKSKADRVTTATVNNDSVYEQLKPLFAALDESALWTPQFSGSNSWVIGPSRSTDGNPLLANDPHIGISKPDVWYEAHIQYPGYETFGYFVPMIPFPMIGHNSTIAWAITMFENDELDLYAETFHPEDPNKVKFMGDWVDIENLTEIIHVKDDKDVSIDIRITPHGPIISDFLKGYSGKPTSFSWVFYQLDNPILDIIYGLGVAENLSEFKNSVSKLVSPGLNISYIDNSGNIAWWAAGKIPVRAKGIDARKILDGASGKHEILGYVPFDQNPQMINPDKGFIVTANNLSTIRAVGDVDKLKGYFRPSDRAARIEEMLETKEKWSVEDLKVIQTDNKLWAADTMKSAILAALMNPSNKWNSLERLALDKLNHWDGFMEVDSQGASIFQFILYQIMQESLSKSLNKEQLKSYINSIDHWNYLKGFFNNDNSLLVNNHKLVITKSFQNAIAELSLKYGNDIDKWNWGAVHTIEYAHPLGQVKPLNYLFNVGPFPSPAEFTVVNKFKSKLGEHDYKVSSLPSTRRLINIGDPSKSFTMLPSGNSGNFMSDNYDDQALPFLQGKYRSVIFTDEQIALEKVHELTLVPEEETTQ